MTADDPAAVATLLDRIRALAPLVDRHRQAIETGRRLPDAIFAALAEAGLFRLWLPRSMGGPQLSPGDFMLVVEAAAAIDASVGWVVGNAAGSSRFAGYLEATAARELFAQPHALVAATTSAVGRAQPVPGGWQVSGRWPFASGIHGATAVAGLCLVTDTEPPMQLMCCAPVGSANIIDTWEVSGLRGTGSCDFTLDAVFVPTGQALQLTGTTPAEAAPLYRLPVLSAFVWSVAVVPLALAGAAITAFAEIARSRTRLGTTLLLAERETVQDILGRAEAMRRAARAFLREAMAALLAGVARGLPDLLPLRADLRLAAAQAADTALRIAALLEAVAGTVAIRETTPLARWLRDCRAAAQHVAMSPSNFAVGGRLQLGLEPGTARI